MAAETADTFLDLACLTYAANDRAQRRSDAAELLTDHPEWTQASLYLAAAVGAIDRVAEHLARDSASALTRGGPRAWDPLLYLCYSRVGSAALRTDTVATARMLLENGADPNTSFSLWGGSFSALTGVLGEGEQGPEHQPPHADADRLAELLFDAGASPNDPQGVYNRMHRPGDAWLRLLLAKGLRATDEINWDMGDGPRPRTLDFVLSHAVDCGFKDRIELLLEHGADPNCRNPYNHRAIRNNALLNGRADLARLLEQSGAEIVPFSVPELFRMACASADAAEARRLLEVDPTCLSDPTLLRDAASQGDLSKVELLLELGADINGPDPGGVTPLHKAAENGRGDVVSVLLVRGADPLLEDHNFHATPLGWAEHAGQLEAARLLREC